MHIEECEFLPVYWYMERKSKPSPLSSFLDLGISIFFFCQVRNSSLQINSPLPVCFPAGLGSSHMF